MGRADPRRRPRRRLRPHPDRRPQRRTARRSHARGSGATHWRARGGEHKPQHGGTADGRRSSRCAGVLRLRPDRRARTWWPAWAAHGAGPENQQMTHPDVTVVVPTLGRRSLRTLLDSLAGSTGPLPKRIVLVDDRRRRDVSLLDFDVPARLTGRVAVLDGRAAGPAAARNVGW